VEHIFVEMELFQEELLVIQPRNEVRDFN